MNTFLDKIGLQRLWWKIKALIPTKVSELENDSGFLTDKEKDYLTFVALEDGTFSFSGSGISYSVDGGVTWTSLAANTNSPTVTAGNKIMWKGTITPSSSGIGTFSSTAKFDVEGNPMSLLYGDDFKGQTDLTGKNNAFKNLFYKCTNIVSAKNLSLPATTLTQYCYSNMFQSCTSLTTAPELPATTLANNCYYYMFNGCTSLTTAPSLPATTLASSCYSNMFRGCTSLTTAPELPATTLTQYCYSNMFRGCTSLTTAPELPATTLTQYCYSNMFQSCTSLTTAPELPATTLANNCYQEMFRDCTSLTTAPELPATTLVNNCYQEMFRGCTKLNYIKAMFTTTPSTTYTSGWVSGVASSGVFVKNSAATWDVTGINGIPSGWTVYTESEWEYAHKYELNAKQDTLVSGTNIKTINNQSLLGKGNITIEGGSGGGQTNVIESVKVNGTALTPDSSKAVDIQSIPAGIVSQDGTHRFVSDTEKSTWNGKQDAISDLEAIRSNASAGAAKVSNVQADWNATSGDAVILNKPTIPTKTSQLTNDSNFLTEDDVQRFFTGTQTISENQDIAGAKDGDIYMKTV